MSVRDAKAPVVAVAGVAIVGLFVGGMIFRSSLGHAPARPLDKPVLVGPAPHWTDGYNHFILTMAAPVPPVADKNTAGALPKGAGRRPAETLTAGAAHGAGAEPAAAPPAIEASLTAKVIRTAKAAGSAARGLGSQWGLPWQAVVPDSSDPIVLRPGQPVSELLKALAHCPKGTKLERDNEGNVRAVPPRGSHCSLPANGRSGGAGPGSRPSTKLPDGLQPDSRAIVASLLAVPGVHSAAPVWGDRYQVVTHLTAAQVKALPGVAAVAPNNLLAAFSATPPQAYDPEFGDEYYLANDGRTLLTDVGTAGASSNFAYGWARSRGGGVVIADIDTGVDLSNPDLAGRILPQSRNYSVTPANNDVQASGTATGFYHATTVDGVMVGVAGNGWGGAGAAPEARILALKCGDSSSLSDSCIYASGEYAIAEKQAGVNVRIVNLSFGEQAGSDSTLYSLMTDLQTAGILVTASAGNFGTDNDSAPVLPAGYSTQFDNVISVGATDNADQLASYSDFGATTVDIMAPGSDMFTDYPTYSGYGNAYVSGTSYAAPMVAAAAALLWSADPSLSYKQVMSDIMNSAQPVPALAAGCVSGGRLDVPAALADVVEPVQFSFGGFDEMSTAGVSDVVVGASAQAGALPAGTALGFHVELAYNYNGTMYDVADDPVGWSLGASGPSRLRPQPTAQPSSTRAG